ncbi:MAG: DUF126 domain-containing protein [Pseudomonadota bacterium]
MPIGDRKREIRARMLVNGAATGPLTALDNPISFWGGVDLATGKLSNPSHPQCGVSLRHAIVLMPHTIGSTAGPGALLELLAADLGPAAILLDEGDPAPVVASRVLSFIGETATPVGVLSKEGYAAAKAWRDANAVLKDGVLSPVTATS